MYFKLAIIDITCYLLLVIKAIAITVVEVNTTAVVEVAGAVAAVEAIALGSIAEAIAFNSKSEVHSILEMR